MAPHQQRVVTEYEELHTRTLALGKFLETTFFLTLDVAERNRLNRQWKLMNEYGQVLSERIAAFE